MSTRLKPVFVGDTAEGDHIVLYQHGRQIYIKRQDGEVRALGSEAVIDRWHDNSTFFTHIKIQSAVWTGEAIGSRKDLIEEPVLVQSYQQET